MKTKVRSAYSSSYFPFLCFFAVLFLFFLMVKIQFTDDKVMMDALSNTNAFDLALQYRKHWSSRLIIEMVYFHLYKIPLVIWKILNALIFVLAAYSISKLAGTLEDKRMNWLACGIVLLYPMTEMINAGWIAAGNNYIWVVALGLYTITPWKNLLTGKKNSKISYLLSILAVFYAANSEQMLALLVGGLALCIVYMLCKRKKFILYHFLWMAALAFVAVLIITAEGPAGRKGIEVEGYYPTFGATHPLIKVYDCFMLFSKHFIGMGNLSLLLLSVAVCVAVYHKYNDLLYRVIASITPLICLSFGLFYPAVVQMFPALERITSELDVGYNTFTSVSSYVPFVLYGVVWISLLVSVYLAFDNKAKALTLTIVLFAGLCSQLVLALSPSIYLSAPRFFIHLHFALLVIGFFAIADYRFYENSKVFSVSQKLVAIASSLALINLFVSI